MLPSSRHVVELLREMLDLSLKGIGHLRVLVMFLLQLILVLVQLGEDAFLREREEPIKSQRHHYLQSAEAAVHLCLGLAALDLLHRHQSLLKHVFRQLRLGVGEPVLLVRNHEFLGKLCNLHADQPLVQTDV